MRRRQGERWGGSVWQLRGNLRLWSRQLRKGSGRMDGEFRQKGEVRKYEVGDSG